MPDEPTNDVSPIRQQINEVRSSKAYTDQWHPSHLQALDTLSRLYSQEYPDPEAPPEQPTEPKAEATDPKAEETPEEDPFGVPATEMEGLKDLRSEWGADFDRNLAQAQGLAAEFAKTYGNEFVGWLETSRAGSNPLIIKAFRSWAVGEPGPEVLAAEARELVKVLRAGEYYGRGNSRMHDVLHNIVTKLYELGYSEGGE
jgi:hypothetical protein